MHAWNLYFKRCGPSPSMLLPAAAIAAWRLQVVKEGGGGGGEGKCKGERGGREGGRQRAH
jgi:hypothetical protein